MAGEEEFDDVASDNAVAVDESPAPAPTDNVDDISGLPSDVQDAIDGKSAPEVEAVEQVSGDEEEQKKDEVAAQALTINPDLQDRAAKAGLSETDIAEFGDEKSLRAAVKLLESRGATAPKTKEAKEGEPETEAAANDEEFKVELDPEKFDENAITVVNTLVGEINNLRKQIRGISTSNSQREAQEFEGFFDGEVNALGAEYEGTFGKGLRHEIDQKSAAFQNRSKLWTAMGTLAAGLQARGEKMPPHKELFKQALRLAFGDKAGEVERKKISSTLQKRKGQFVNKPTSRDTRDARSTEQQVVDKVAEKMVELGMDPGHRTVDEI